MIQDDVTLYDDMIMTWIYLHIGDVYGKYVGNYIVHHSENGLRNVAATHYIDG